VDVMKSAATKAMWSVVRQAQEGDIQQISLLIMSFKAMVLPVMSYGCEIRSLPFLTSKLLLANPFEEIQNMFLRPKLSAIREEGVWMLPPAGLHRLNPSGRGMV